MARSKEMRVTQNILKVFAVMLNHPNGQHYALDLSRQAKVNIGSIYAVMARLERYCVITAAFEDIDPTVEGRPARRYYTFTEDGLRFARNAVAETKAVLFPGGVAHA